MLRTLLQRLALVPVILAAIILVGAVQLGVGLVVGETLTAAWDGAFGTAIQVGAYALLGGLVGLGILVGVGFGSAFIIFPDLRLWAYRALVVFTAFWLGADIRLSNGELHGWAFGLTLAAVAFYYERLLMESLTVLMAGANRNPEEQPGGTEATTSEDV